jgi:hypothetical protein
MVKQVTRYRRKKKYIIETWPDSLPQAEALVELVRYVGSQEHKDYPSYAGESGLRSDAARCDPEITREQAEAILKRAIELQCVSPQQEGKYPRYVWGWLDGHLYQARLINREQGWYKAWPIEAIEAPLDPHGRLQDKRWHV